MDNMTKYLANVIARYVDPPAPSVRVPRPGRAVVGPNHMLSQTGPSENPVHRRAQRTALIG